MHTHNREIEKTSGQATQLNILTKLSMDKKLSSSSGELEFVAQ
jgi:hypothetical protein